MRKIRAPMGNLRNCAIQKCERKIRAPTGTVLECVKCVVIYFTLKSRHINKREKVVTNAEKKNKKFNYHLSVAAKKLIINVCDEIPLASLTEKASYASSKIGRPVSTVTVRILTKKKQEKIINDSWS